MGIFKVLGLYREKVVAMGRGGLFHSRLFVQSVLEQVTFPPRHLPTSGSICARSRTQQGFGGVDVEETCFAWVGPTPTRKSPNVQMPQRVRIKARLAQNPCLGLFCRCYSG